MNLSRHSFFEWLIGDHGTQGGYRLYWDRKTNRFYWADKSGGYASYNKPEAMQNEVQKRCVIAFIVTPQTSC